MSTVDGATFIAEMLADDDPTFAAASPTGEPEINFSVKKFVLSLLLEKAAHIVPNRDVMPVLKNFQIETRPGRLRVVATDLELSMICTTELVNCTTAGTAVFPARKMLDIVREAAGDLVDIRVSAGVAAITIGRTTWSLRLQGGADYPPMPEITETTFATADRSAFIRGLHAVRYAACKDAERASLMMINVQGGRMTACDGSRFQQAVLPDFPLSIQIPIGAVDDLLKLLRGTDVAEISIGEADHHLIFRLGTDVLIVNKLMAQFPNMEALLLRPALENKHPVTVDRDQLLDAVKRVRITADPETSAIGLTLAEGALTVSARDKYGNAADETVEAGWDAAARTVVVNHAFLTDMIHMYEGKTLHFRLGDDTRNRKAPVMLTDPDTGTVGVVQQMLSDWVGAVDTPGCAKK